jgi:hypothetical protein
MTIEGQALVIIFSKPIRRPAICELSFAPEVQP